jgi:hypothetical protein
VFQGDLKRVLYFDCIASRIEINEKKDESFFDVPRKLKGADKRAPFSLAFSHRLVVVQDNTTWVPERV